MSRLPTHGAAERPEVTSVRRLIQCRHFGKCYRGQKWELVTISSNSYIVDVGVECRDRSLNVIPVLVPNAFCLRSLYFSFILDKITKVTINWGVGNVRRHD